MARALELADAEGIEAVTIRRLAQRLGVTPMALYWHFKNKDELLVGMFDAVFAQLADAPDPGDSWRRGLRAMVTALVEVMRRHRWITGLKQTAAKRGTQNFHRATDRALALLTEGGYPPERAFQVASYLLNGVTALVAGDPSGPPGMSPAEAELWRRANRLELESLPPGEYPCLVEYGRLVAENPDVEGYYAFGVDLLMAGVEAMAPGDPVSPPASPAPAEPR